MTIFTRAFWKASGERAIKTFAQTFGGFLVVGAFSETDWATGWQSAAVAALLSIATSVGSDHIGNPGPSLAGEVVIPDPLA